MFRQEVVDEYVCRKTFEQIHECITEILCAPDSRISTSQFNSDVNYYIGAVLLDEVFNRIHLRVETPQRGTKSFLSPFFLQTFHYRFNLLTNRKHLLLFFILTDNLFSTCQGTGDGRENTHTYTRRRTLTQTNIHTHKHTHTHSRYSFSGKGYGLEECSH